MSASKITVDTVSAKDCYDPADYILVHKNHLARLKNNSLAIANKSARDKLTAIESTRDELVRALKLFDKWLSDRDIWLTKEMNSGGDFVHLNIQRQECKYISEKMRDMLTVTTVLAIANAGKVGA